jgi:hypothetical protein
MIKQILKFFNSIQLHYGKLNSVNERDIKLIDEEALIKLSIKHGSVEKIFESLILKYEKGVDINDEYINKVFSEYKIDIDQANSLLSKLKQPKEPSFSKKALLKTPDFSKSKFEEIAKPSFSNKPKSQNKIEIDKANGNPKNTNIKKNKTLKEEWNRFTRGQKIGFVVLGIVIFGMFSNILNSMGSPIKISSVYWVNDKDGGLECYECDRSWKLKFLSEFKFELWTYYGDKGQYISCRSTGNYSYDKDSKTITILNITSSNAINCVSKFKGRWKYRKDDLGLNAFISLNNPSWKFQTYGR